MTIYRQSGRERAKEKARPDRRANNEAECGKLMENNWKSE